MKPHLDLTREIVPSVGLGGFEVGRPLRDYESILKIDQRVINVRVWPFWQVVYRLPQLYAATPSERSAFLDASDEWVRRRRKGEPADIGPAVSMMRPPESEPAIELWVDVRDGRLDAVAALAGYEGRFRELRTGMTFGEARTAEPQLTEPSFLDEVQVEGVDGLRLSFDPPDPPDSDDDPSIRDEAILKSIVVFDPSRSGGGVKPF